MTPPTMARTSTGDVPVWLLFCWAPPLVDTLNSLVEIDDGESERVEASSDGTAEETGVFVWLPPVDTLVWLVGVGDGVLGLVGPGLVELSGSETVAEIGVGLSG